MCVVLCPIGRGQFVAYPGLSRARDNASLILRYFDVYARYILVNIRGRTDGRTDGRMDRLCSVQSKIVRAPTILLRAHVARNTVQLKSNRGTEPRVNRE